MDASAAQQRWCYRRNARNHALPCPSRAKRLQAGKLGCYVAPTAHCSIYCSICRYIRSRGMQWEAPRSENLGLHAACDATAEDGGGLRGHWGMRADRPKLASFAGLSSIGSTGASELDLIWRLDVELKCLEAVAISPAQPPRRKELWRHLDTMIAPNSTEHSRQPVTLSGAN